MQRWPSCYTDKALETTPQRETANNVANILKRGHTVDRLSEAELQEVAKSIEQLQKQRGQGSKEAPRANSGAAASSKGPNPEAAEAEKPQHEMKPDENNGEVMKTEEKKETKAERKKRLHARNMRYYRSFLSSLALNVYAPTTCARTTYMSVTPRTL